MFGSDHALDYGKCSLSLEYKPSTPNDGAAQQGQCQEQDLLDSSTTVFFEVLNPFGTTFRTVPILMF